MRANTIGTNWSGEMTVDENTTTIINEAVELSGDTEVSVAEGKTLTVNGGINCGEHTLTFVGQGSMTVNGKNGLYGEDIAERGLDEGEVHAGPAVNGSLIVKGGTLNPLSLTAGRICIPRGLRTVWICPVICRKTAGK